ncbi:MAG: UDP-4-amino-4,6-dideoxy-N-acetyl-beta-L-altrosamine N-acetyltransferase [bacterium]
MKKWREYSLRPMREDDLEMIRAWRNTKRIRDVSFTDHIISKKEHAAWFEKNKSVASFNIFMRGQEPLGFVQVTHFTAQHDRAFWGFYLGKKNLPRGTGLIMGYLAMRLVFDELKVHKLCSEIFSSNTTSIRLHQKLGFQQEGVLREHAIKKNRHQDVILMALLEKDWRRRESAIKEALL